MRRKALLVGINDYAPAGAGGPDLRGCVNDVRDMASTLNALGIVPALPGNMRILTDARATRKNIMDGLKWLVTDAKKGDVLVFHYSGHGSQLPDIGGGDELDAFDETICPHDYATAGMIKDDDLRRAFAHLAAGVNLDVLLDSCHSGTATRDLLMPTDSLQEPTIVCRYVEPPLDEGFFLETNPQLRRKSLLRTAPGEKALVLAPGLNHALWAGCRDNQTSAESVIKGSYRGVFTYAYCKTLRAAGATITRARLSALVCDYVKKLGYSQVPQLEGTKPTLFEKVFT